MAIELLITTAGLDALVDAQTGETDAIRVIEVGLTASAFTMAPTLTALPGEFKRIDAVSGQAVSETVIHMTAQDSSTDVYDLRGIGLYLEDGTLFAVYAQPDPIFRKVSIAAFLLALDIAFANGAAGDIVFGDATFLSPPATETVKGVAEIATLDEATTGTDHSRIITPLTLSQRLAAFSTILGGDIAALLAQINALKARTVTGSGAATGGGPLTGNVTIDVPRASIPEAAAGSDGAKVLTPASFYGALWAMGGWNAAIPIFRIPGTPIIVQTGRVRHLFNGEQSYSMLFPQAFPNFCLYVGPVIYIASDSQYRDLKVQMRETSLSGFNIYLQGDDGADNLADGFDWIAIGA